MKTIRSPRDLAIFGAPPAMDAPLHVGQPNVGDRVDYFRRLERVLDSRRLTNDGPQLREFEDRVATTVGVGHCVATCNGTAALSLAVRALGLSGEVVVPSFTYVATVQALHWQGIVPVFADIDPDTHNIDAGSVRDIITPNTTGILGVHLWGRGVDHRALSAVASDRGLAIMYDAAQAFGCSAGGRMIGGFGSCEVLSFHATKVLNTIEGGAVVTDDRHLATRLRLMRNFGFADGERVVCEGTNAKMSEVAAAMGSVNLDSLPEFIASNRRNYTAYEERLKRISGLRLLEYDPRERCHYHYIVLEVDPDFSLSRDDVLDVLHAENIIARRYFWPGCHLMQPFRAARTAVQGPLPNTEAVLDRILVLPNGSSVSVDEVHAVCSVLEMTTQIDSGDLAHRGFGVRHHGCR